MEPSRQRQAAASPRQPAARDGRGQERPRRDTAASPSPTPRAPATGPPPRPRPPRPPSPPRPAAARRVQRHRTTAVPATPGAEPPHPPRRGPEPAQPVPHGALRDPARRSDRPAAALRSPRQHVPITAVPAQRRAAPTAGAHVRTPQEPHRPRRGRNPTATRLAENTDRDCLAPPAQPTPAAGTPEQPRGVIEELQRHRCAVGLRATVPQAPPGPPPAHPRYQARGGPTRNRHAPGSSALITPPPPAT